MFLFQSNIRSCNTSKCWLLTCVFRTYAEQRIRTRISHLTGRGYGYLSTPINTCSTLHIFHTAKMNPRIRKQRAFLNFMLDGNGAQQKWLIKSYTNELYDVISEIALNIYKGTYPLTKKYINQLTPYQLFIRSLGSRKVSAK